MFLLTPLLCLGTLFLFFVTAIYVTITLQDITKLNDINFDEKCLLCQDFEFTIQLIKNSLNILRLKQHILRVCKNY